MPARSSLCTPHPGASGAAISIISMTTDEPAEMDSILRSLGMNGLARQSPSLRDIAGIDTGIVVRWSPTLVHLMVHGGSIIIQQVLSKLAPLGVVVEKSGRDKVSPDASVLARFPEASDFVEACALDALAHAASPLAVDVILKQREAWSADAPLVSDTEARALNHLLAPPTVVLLGAPNIGKSTLTNALAKRRVSIVADEPGTTRDHVGVMLNMGGLCVRWIDAPGINPVTSDPIERAAIDLALNVAAHADLVLLCSDAATAPPATTSSAVLRVGLRADLGLSKDAVAVSVSAHSGAGLDELAIAVRDRLVPPSAMKSGGRWRFHPALAPRRG